MSDRVWVVCEFNIPDSTDLLCAFTVEEEANAYAADVSLRGKTWCWVQDCRFFETADQAIDATWGELDAVNQYLLNH
jgi:hypothetical protein